MQPVASHTPRTHRTRITACVVALLAVAAPALAQRTQAPAPTTTLDRIREAGRIRLGYRTDARPFSYRDEAGNAAGYSAELCQRITEAVKAELALAALTVEWVPVTIADRFQAVQEGRIDLLCGAASETLARRAEVSFSIPVFPDGIGALLRADASPQLREVLMGEKPSYGPQWRGSAYRMLQTQKFTVVQETTAEPWLSGRLKDFQLTATVTSVDAYAAGVQAVLDRKADVLFGDRAILMAAAARHPSADKLVVLDRFFTYEPVTLVLARDQDAFRLMVDRALSRFFADEESNEMFARWFGQPSERVLTFFRWTILPE
jgi:ABC-type amino acid transport substrate-binding protein